MVTVSTSQNKAQVIRRHMLSEQTGQCCTSNPTVRLRVGDPEVHPRQWAVGQTTLSTTSRPGGLRDGFAVQTGQRGAAIDFNRAPGTGEVQSNVEVAAPQCADIRRLWGAGWIGLGPTWKVMQKQFFSFDSVSQH